MTIEILVPTGGRTLGGATRAVIETLLSRGFQNIDPPESGVLEVELRNVDEEEHARSVPDEVTPADLGEEIKANREILRVRVGLRLGCFLLYPGFCVLSRPDEYEAFEDDPRARQIIGREALELARAFGARELLVCGDAASDFLGTEATTWDQLCEVIQEEDVPHKRIQIPAPKPGGTA
jgi:hypothetical protein